MFQIDSLHGAHQFQKHKKDSFTVDFVGKNKFTNTIVLKLEIMRFKLKIL